MSPSSNAIFIGSDQYRRAAFGQNHPLAIPRVEVVYDLCNILGWLPAGSFEESPSATIEDLTKFHASE
ncbi:MAG: hypothetical protein ACR2OX_05665, partial [Methyloligellaceae bacterium]